MFQKDTFEESQLSYVDKTAPDSDIHQWQPPSLVINQLHFRTNSTTILPFLRSKAASGSGHPLFTLNSIVQRPEVLVLPPSEGLFRLSLQNMSVPILDEKVKAQFLACLPRKFKGKQPQPALYGEIALLRKTLLLSKGAKAQFEVLEQAVVNYENVGYFCQLDWGMDHWGTTEDIHSVTESTFHLPTAFLEFQTTGTPPVIALQQLANTFPSVLFTLRFRCLSEDQWHEVQFYPFPPFGY